MHGTDVAKFDVAIIGAGLHGVSMARFWLDTHPEDNLLIIERDAGVGGVWSHERTFDNFWLQSPEQLDFFSDSSLELPENMKMVWGTFPSKYISEYLEAYIDRPIFDNRSLRSRTWFKSEVSSLSKEGSVWRIDFADSSLRPSVLASKVAIATGLTSQPNLPGFIKEPDFGIPYVHHRDFGRNCKRILSSDSPYKTITVIGGGKSSVDLIVAALDAGTKDVNWIIRTSGEGPGLFVWPESKRYNNSGNYVMTQTGTSMGVSGWGDQGLEPKPKTEIEAAESRKTIEKRIQMRDQICSDFARYHGRPDALPCFADLAPDANGSFFWQTAPCGSIQREDFWDKVSKKVQVYRGDIVGHTSDSLVLQDGRAVPTDFLLCGTGWSADYPFISSDLAHKLGLPHDTSAESPEEAEQWARLSQEADESIFERHPILKDGPARPSKRPARQGRTPVRLYKAMTPLTDQSIVFLGRCKVLTNYILAEAQAVWVTALWDGNVPFPEADEAKRAVVYMNRFSRWRYPNRGGDGVSFQLDQLWYIDNILREAGLSSHRKAWWTDKEEPIVSADLADCKDEYLAKHAKEMVQAR